MTFTVLTTIEDRLGCLCLNLSRNEDNQRALCSKVPKAHSTPCSNISRRTNVPNMLDPQPQRHKEKFAAFRHRMRRSKQRPLFKLRTRTRRTSQLSSKRDKTMGVSTCPGVCLSKTSVFVVDSLKSSPVKDCSLDVDVVLTSSDGKQLGAHMANLASFNTGFPLINDVNVSVQDTAALTEDSQTLALLLTFSHNELNDHLLNGLGIDKIGKLREASHRYGNSYAYINCSLAVKCVESFLTPSDFLMTPFCRRIRHEKCSPENALKMLAYLGAQNDVSDVDVLIQRALDLPTPQVDLALRGSPRMFSVYVGSNTHARTPFHSWQYAGSVSNPMGHGVIELPQDHRHPSRRGRFLLSVYFRHRGISR